MYTKEIVKDKFWILENAGTKIGTIRFCSSNDFELNIRQSDLSDAILNEHMSLSELTSHFGEKILESKESPVVVEENKVGPRGGWNTSMNEIDGYPSKHVVYNTETIELKDKQIPTYTKTETSKVRYVAGYYGVRFPFVIKKENFLTAGEKTEDTMGQLTRYYLKELCKNPEPFWEFIDNNPYLERSDIQLDRISQLFEEFGDDVSMELLLGINDLNITV
jgi:hypothetical protein